MVYYSKNIKNLYSSFTLKAIIRVSIAKTMLVMHPNGN